MRRTFSWAVAILSLGTVPLVRGVHKRLAGTKTGHVFWWTATIGTAGLFALAYYSCVGIASLVAAVDDDDLDDDDEDLDDDLEEEDDEYFEEEDDDDFDDDDDDDDDDDPRTWAEVAADMEAEEAAASLQVKAANTDDNHPEGIVFGEEDDDDSDVKYLSRPSHGGGSMYDAEDEECPQEESQDFDGSSHGSHEATARGRHPLYDDDSFAPLHVVFVRQAPPTPIWALMPCGSDLRRIESIAAPLLFHLDQVAKFEEPQAAKWSTHVSRLLPGYRAGCGNTSGMRSLIQNVVIPGLLTTPKSRDSEEALVFAQHLLAAITDAEQCDWDRDATQFKIGPLIVRPLPDDNDVIERLAVAYTEFHRDASSNPQTYDVELRHFVVAWQIEICRTRGFTLGTRDGLNVAIDDSDDVVFVFELARSGQAALDFLEEAGLY